MAGVQDVGDAWERNLRSGWRGPGRLITTSTTGRLNFPQFVALLPGAGQRTLDVGCGDASAGGWRHAHSVVGIDSSPTLTAAAQEAGGYDKIVCGDAASLPWPNGAFDLAIAYMSLHDMPDPEAVIGEIARVLCPGSQLAIAIIHPLNRADEDLDRYFERLRFRDRVIRGGLRMTFDGVDRPLSDYTAALTGHGFVIDRLTEPKPSAEDCRADESLIKASRRPYFLHIRCRLSR
jgi:SAM-dependent methyltransferase